MYIKVYPTEKMCFFHLKNPSVIPKILEQTDPILVEVHPSVLTFLPNQKPHNQSVQQFTNQKRPLHQRFFPPFPTSPPGQAMAAHFVSAHASIWTSQTTSCGPRFHDWRVVSGGSILRWNRVLPCSHILKYIPKYQRWQTGGSCLVAWKVQWLQFNFKEVYRTLKRTLITTVPVFWKSTVITVFSKRTLIYSH